MKNNDIEQMEEILVFLETDAELKKNAELLDTIRKEFERLCDQEFSRSLGVDEAPPATKADHGTFRNGPRFFT